MPDATAKPVAATPANCPSGDPENPFRYTAALADAIELRWQAWWEENQSFRTPNPGEPGFDPAKPKFFSLDMFPYPSGAGLHVGHPEGYTATDIVSRFKRLKGYQVLHPMGWDAFGLPAEQYAIQTGVHPAVTTRSAIDTFRRQLKRFGFSYDWSREFATIDEDYYKWTQWIWLKAYDAWFDHDANRARPIDELIRALQDGDAYVGPSDELVWKAMAGDTAAVTGQPIGCRAWHELSSQERRSFIDDRRLAYLGQQTVNWCPELGTVLANEEVIDGRSERGGYPVHRIPLKQWMFRITDYAERLLEDMTTLDWPDSTRTMQREWIGRSEGAEVDFEISNLKSRISIPAIRVFTTRPDTIFGATYTVLAPEHALVDEILSLSAQGVAFDGMNRAELDAYVKQARNRADVERLADTKDKTGVFTGLHAINPATGERIPVWVADYVLMGYGHGAIMAVPGHDERDFEFAQKFGLPIRDVVHNRMLAAIAAGAAQGSGVSNEDWSTRFVEFVAVSIGDNITDPAQAWRIVEGRHQKQAIKPAPKPKKNDDIKALLKTPLSEIGPDPEQYRMIATIWYEALLDASGGDLSQLARAAKEGRLVEMLARPVPEAGIAVNSENEEVSLNGLPTPEAKKRIIEWLDRTGNGRRKINFKLRDWLFSRQRYWGEPFPIVYDEAGNHYPVSEKHLPVVLPEMEDYRPIQSDTPQPPLAKATNWVKTTAGEAGVSPDLLPPETPVTRETNTMPGWAGSCWYYLRYCDPHNDERFISREAERYWMISLKRSAQEKGASKNADYDPSTHHIGGVDLYIGGAEHAVLHLLYARFWHKILFDLGEVSTPEPMGRLFHQGMICSYAYQRADKSLVPVDEVKRIGDEQYVEIKSGEPVTQIVAKMSKSLKNVVNPDDIIREFGADTFRLYEMYMGPLEATKPWNTRDMVGPFRFLQRLWRLAVNEQTGELNLVESPNADIEKQLHRAIAKVEQDVDRLAFNTAIAAMIEFVNVATNVAAAQTAAGSGGKSLTRDQLERFTIVLAPFAPHVAEELWQRLGHDDTITYAAWPSHDPALLIDDEIELAVQIMGKVRSRITVPADADNETVEKAALADGKIRAFIDGKTVRKVIVVPGKLVNIVAN